MGGNTISFSRRRGISLYSRGESVAASWLPPFPLGDDGGTAMSELVLQRSATVGYKDVFLLSLIVVSAIPLAIALINFEILDASVYAMTMFWSFLVFLGGAHVWISLAYYCDRKWLGQFRHHPVIFFAIPAGLIVSCMAIMSWHNVIVGLTLVYGTLVINLWHHAKQNWGVLSLMAKCRRADVAHMRIPLVYAWPFFIASVGLYMPEISTTIGADVLRSAAYLLAAVYICSIAGILWKNRDAAEGDPVIFAFSIVLCLYFVPLVTLHGKPYALLVAFGAHAMQYYLLVLMSLSLSDWRSVDLRKTAIAFAIALVAVAGATYIAYEANQAYGPPAMWESLWVRLVVGFVTGVNLVHFWLDAFIWRFSDKEMRKLHGEAFAF